MTLNKEAMPFQSTGEEPIALHGTTEFTRPSCADDIFGTILVLRNGSCVHMRHNAKSLRRSDLPWANVLYGLDVF